MKLTYYDGSDQESLERNFTAGAYTTARLFFLTAPAMKGLKKNTKTISSIVCKIQLHISLILT